MGTTLPQIPGGTQAQPDGPVQQRAPGEGGEPQSGAPTLALPLLPDVREACPGRRKRGAPRTRSVLKPRTARGSRLRPRRASRRPGPRHCGVRPRRLCAQQHPPLPGAAASPCPIATEPHGGPGRRQRPGAGGSSLLTPRSASRAPGRRAPPAPGRHRKLDPHFRQRTGAERRRRACWES